MGERCRLERLSVMHSGDAAEPSTLANVSAEKAVLVAYATRFGSTRGVAERIAAKLRQHAVRVELRSAEDVDGMDRYAAVILGSAVFGQRWIPAAEALVRNNEDVLSRRPVWLFSVGTFDDRKRLIGPLMRREPKGIKAFEQAIRPRDYRVFAGVIDRHQWPLPSRIFYYAFGGRLGDNRNWPEIDAWAAGIARWLAPNAAGREDLPQETTGSRP
jgi:menaquinone-dependent protoporphyrinogen oxidase